MKTDNPQYFQIYRNMIMDYNPNGMHTGVVCYYLRLYSSNKSFKEAISIPNRIMACAIRRKSWNKNKTVRPAGTVNTRNASLKVPAKECRINCIYEFNEDDGMMNIYKYEPSEEDLKATDWEIYTVFATNDIEHWERREAQMEQISE